MAKLRVGFLSTAQIGRKNAGAALASGVCELVAVASRDLPRAQAFANAWGFARAYGSYEELLADETIDAVYIPLPTALRAEWAIKAGEAGKHVLCDKPCAVSFDELARMTTACRQRGTQFMDGVMFMHHDRLGHMERYLRDPAALGEVHRVTSGFTFAGSSEFRATNIRTDAALEPAGCIGDLGWYTIRWALFALNYELPTHASAVAHVATPGGVPLDVSATLYYADAGKVATFDCGFTTALRQWCEVAGTGGILRCDDFVLNKSGGSKFTVTLNPTMKDLDRDVEGAVTEVNVQVPYGHQETQM